MNWFHPTLHEPDLPQARAIQRPVPPTGSHTSSPGTGLRAVLVRLSRTTARRDVADLCPLDVETVDTPYADLRAAALSSRFSRHLFDTPYHAVALSVLGCVLVTVDARYFAKAQDAGRILRLSGWEG